MELPEMDSYLVVETERLQLRTIGEGDEEAFIQLCHEEGFNDFSSGRYSEMNAEKARSFIDAERTRFQTTRLGRFGVFETESGELTGVAALFEMQKPFEDSVELGYRLASKFRGKGYATEASQALLNYGFTELKLKQLLAIVDEENTVSQKLLKKVGMTYLGNVLYYQKSRQLWCRENENANIYAFPEKGVLRSGIDEDKG